MLICALYRFALFGMSDSDYVIMMDKKHFSQTLVRFLANLLGILVFGLILANVSLPDISSLSSFNPAERNVDFCSADFYQMVADGRSEKVLDDQIVIVPIDELSRQGICHLLEDLSLCSPLAIGLDVFFQFPMEGDDKLLDVLCQTERLVTPMGVVPHAGAAPAVMGSYLLDSLAASQRGIVNMNITRRYHVVRDFLPLYQTDRGDMAHFVLALARQADPSAAEALCKQSGGDLTQPVSIDYASREFETIPPSEVLERIDDIEGRIVLLGAVSDAQDIHITPVDDSMPGILIHAHALSTILRQHCKSQMPPWALWVLGILIGILFVGAKIGFDQVAGGNTLMRLFQLFMLLIIVYIGCVLYIQYDFVLELSLPLAVVALGFVALDFWKDFCQLLIKIAKKMNLKLFQRLFSALLLLCFASASMQAAPFRVFKHEGDVKILQQDAWAAVAERQEVTARDQFMLGENARLGIVDYATRRIYYTTKPGKQNVAQIISAARRETDRIASSMRKQLSASGGANEQPLAILGGVNRGSAEQASAADAIYREIYHRLNAAEIASTEQLKAEMVTEGGACFFKISNATSAPLFVNVIRLPASEGENPQLCLEVGYTESEPYQVIAPEKETELRHYAFLPEEVPHKYLVVGSEKPYDCQALRTLLKIFAPPQDNAPDSKPSLYFSIINDKP